MLDLTDRRGFYIMKLKLQDKQRIIELWKSGYGCAMIAKQFNVVRSTIIHFIEKYQIYGDKVVQEKKQNKVYSVEFKLRIIERVKNGEAINSIANEYMLHNGMIHAWIKKYEELGYNGLITQKRGRPKMNQIKSKKKYMLTDDERKQYEARIKQLEMENELLKKLDAFVQERIKQEREKK